MIGEGATASPRGASAPRDGAAPRRDAAPRGPGQSREPQGDCVVLAAGASRRMGRAKLHLPFGPTSLLGATIAAALGAGLRVILVGRPEDGELATHGREPSVLLVRNPRPERGMLSSLQAGFAAAFAAREGRGEEGEAPLLFIPADMPLVRSESYRLLLGAAGAAPLVAACGGRRGHPVLLPAVLAREVLALGEGANLRELLEASGTLLVETGDPGCLLDVDQPADYERALRLGPGLSPACIPPAGG